eukprot:1927280-Prymnesium_polylepis.1
MVSPSAAASSAVDECDIETTSAVGDDTLELLAAKLLRLTVAPASSPAGVDDADSALIRQSTHPHYLCGARSGGVSEIQA